MRSLLTLLACMMMVMTAWSGVAHAEGVACNETAGQAAMHWAGDCGEVPADADKNYPHCHTGCHGHHTAAPIPGYVPARPADGSRAYAPAAPATLTAHQVDQTLRPPQA